ncbi:hypothetical protein GCM10023264_11560 [Sphingomonas daechungensis]
MTRFHSLLLVAGLASLPSPAAAQASDQATGPAVGVELFASTDSDHTDVVKLLGRGAILDAGPDRYFGVAIEQAWFSPLGQKTRKDQRVYADLAGKAGKDWLWKARLGTDGKTWLGSANLRSKDWSKEVFLEREIIETPRGVDEGLYYTFLGASFDVPVAKDTLTFTGAVQAFTGRNERLHARASYVHVIKADIGLSAQLRTRFFHSTAPGEYDYYSPKNFFQLLPVVQMRRFTTSGWMLLGAVGYGAQRATGGGWASARLAEVRVESPRGRHAFRAFAQAQYSNNSISGSGNYDYVMARIGLTKSLN